MSGGGGWASEQGLPSLAADKRPFLVTQKTCYFARGPGKGRQVQSWAKESVSGGGLSVTGNPLERGPLSTSPAFEVTGMEVLN